MKVNYKPTDATSVVVHTPRTNGDRIRAMNDEELAEFLMTVLKSRCFGEGCFPYHPCNQEQNCKQCALDWLRQEANDG